MIYIGGFRTGPSSIGFAGGLVSGFVASFCSCFLSFFTSGFGAVLDSGFVFRVGKNGSSGRGPIGFAEPGVGINGGVGLIGSGVISS